MRLADMRQERRAGKIVNAADGVKRDEKGRDLEIIGGRERDGCRKYEGGRVYKTVMESEEIFGR